MSNSAKSVVILQSIIFSKSYSWPGPDWSCKTCKIYFYFKSFDSAWYELFILWNVRNENALYDKVLTNRLLFLDMRITHCDFVSHELYDSIHNFFLSIQCVKVLHDVMMTDWHKTFCQMISFKNVFIWWTDPNFDSVIESYTVFV